MFPILDVEERHRAQGSTFQNDRMRDRTKRVRPPMSGVPGTLRKLEHTCDDGIWSTLLFSERLIVDPSRRGRAARYPKLVARFKSRWVGHDFQFRYRFLFGTVRKAG